MLSVESFPGAAVDALAPAFEGEGAAVAAEAGALALAAAADGVDAAAVGAFEIGGSSAPPGCVRLASFAGRRGSKIARSFVNACSSVSCGAAKNHVSR